MSYFQFRLEDPGAPDFAADVVEILNSTLPRDSATSPENAASTLDSISARHSAENGTTDSFFWWFWDSILDLSRQVPHDSPEQDRLAEIVKALHNLPPKKVKLQEEQKSSVLQAWRGLPSFDQIREKLSDDTRAADESQRKERAVNLNAFAARVAGLGIVPLDTYAIWALVDALEGTMTPIRGAPDEVNSDPAAVDGIHYKVKSAAAWMVHAGHVLYGRDEEVHGATAGPLWLLPKKEAIELRLRCRGTNGLCPERWLLWKERFAAIRDCDSLDATTREEAEKAYVAMERTENSAANVTGTY
ncbi:hypothetical protein B0J13DRAFT_642502 [Dactylonectria estremocensis]|uniref:Uncharacterized protein n=1 Tax=Dactylonectria estremocensis TaxID=1079267 RepID=A0A9P9IUM2_9HYPO|nr:hypothetical protein B0J13DRAFT_642502 [Dactylonectria estremocensis]